MTEGDKDGGARGFELSLWSRGQGTSVTVTPRGACDEEVASELARDIIDRDMRAGPGLALKIERTLEGSFGRISDGLAGDLMRACRAAEAIASDPRASALLVRL